uniref:NAD(P)-binding domain-containing protein n=1 Tax=Cyclophora tenuis TaxID=216820 RepID=A0A7S1DCB9_CYCTE
MNAFLCAVISCWALTSTAFAFSPTIIARTWTKAASKVSLSMKEENNDDLSSFSLDRRQMLGQTLSASVALGGMSFLPMQAIAEGGGIGTNPEHPIVVIGAGGKCGKLCTEILNAKGLYTKGVTRSGRETLDSPSKFVSYGPGDVTSYDSIKAAVQGASGVIFAASASGKKKGGEPKQVDYVGVYNTAKACLECSVPKLVVISAGTVTRPDSAGFKATNFFVKYVYGDKIMDYKIAGEEAMRELYAASSDKSLGYAVVRPGGLSDGPPKGSAELNLSQGDVLSSEISRTDVAEVTVAALLKGAATDFTTFELNQNEGLNKAQGNLPDLPSELIHTGTSSYGGLLDGLFTDQEMQSKYPSIVNSFKGAGIEPIGNLA